MKAINLTNMAKIGVLSIGALLTATSTIAAGVMYQNVELVSPNGQPTAKIAVGSTAAISDGIAAANIASVLANHAYKSSTLTAAVNGQATCAAGGSGTGTGTCSISNQQVTITINLPGVLGNAYQFKTLITDTIDKTLGNRNNTQSQDNYSIDTAASDTSGQILSPLRGASSVSSYGTNLYRIGGEAYQGFRTQPFGDPQASSEFAYQEEQNFWVGSAANGVAYTTDTIYGRQVVAQPSVMAYNIRFLGNDFGIPLCTKANDAGDGNWGWCTTDSTSQYASANHRIGIWFLGQQWVISAMSPPSTNVTSTSSVKNGGTIKLAKEAKYDIINVGGVIDGGTFKVRLADISTATGQANAHPAIIDILDANDAVVGQIQVQPGDTYTFTQSSTGQSIMVHVYRTAPGFTLNAKWSEIAIYTNEITLQDGQSYNLVSTGDANYYLKASLLWKNRDATGSNNNLTDSLREIVLYDTHSFNSKKFVPGDSYSFPAKDPKFALTYNGLDLVDADYVPISFRPTDPIRLPIGQTGNCNVQTGTYQGAFIEVRSDGGAAFGGVSDLLKNYMVDSFYIDPIGNDDGSSDGELQDFSAATWKSQIFYLPAGCNNYLRTQISSDAISNLSFGTHILTHFTATGGDTSDPAGSGAVRFETAGSESSAPGAIRWFFVDNNDATAMDSTTSGYADDLSADGPVGELVLQEDAGQMDRRTNSTSHAPVLARFPVYSTGDGWEMPDGDLFYQGVRDGLAQSYEAPLYTERGSVVDESESEGVAIHAAKRIAHPTFTFAPVGADGSSSSGSDWIANVGDSTTLPDGATLTVKYITQQVGVCVAGSSGAAPACTVNMQPVTATIMDSTGAVQGATVQASQPYDIKGTSLVVSDVDATNVGGVVITVGGPAVNSMTASILKDAPHDWDASPVLVRAYGSRIVVAGHTAADTWQAAEEFMASLTTN